MPPRELRPPASLQPERRWPTASDAISEEERGRVAEVLGVHFANDDLSVDELERRLALVFQATGRSALERLLEDLPPLGQELSPVDAPSPPVVARGVPERGVHAAVMGATVRKGVWLVPRYLKVVAVMGAAELDLRQACFAPGVTEIEVFALMGGVEIVVPPGVRVEMMGVAVMGGFETSAGDASSLEPDQPVLRISGLALMAGVDAIQKRPSTKALRKFRAALRAARKRAEKEQG